MLKNTYFPSHEDNRMTHEGDITEARKRFLQERPASLNRLLSQRFLWMNEYLLGRKMVVELGAGAGFSKEFLNCSSIILTDVVKRPWTDMVVDAMNPPFDENSVDVIICSHMLHHVASPTKFFNIARSKLKPGGILLIQDLHTSLMLRVLLRIMRHEGWSYEIDVFNEDAIANDPADPWSANCAIPELLFRNEKVFMGKIKGFRILRNQLNESLLFPLSGGVIAKTKIIQFPPRVYAAIQHIDKVLVKMLPNIFAVGRSVALEKVT